MVTEKLLLAFNVPSRHAGVFSFMQLPLCPPGTPWIADSAGLTADLNVAEKRKILSWWESNPGTTARRLVSEVTKS